MPYMFIQHLFFTLAIKSKHQILFMISEELVKQLMQIALKQAQKATEVDEVPVGGVFVRVGEDQKYEVVKSAHNLTNRTKNASEHSEMICLKQLEREGRLEEARELILFVTVEPCIMCTHALNLAKVKHVYFGQFNDKFGGCGSVLKLSEFECSGGHFAEESKNILKYFYEKGNLKLPEDKRNRKRMKEY